MAAFAAVCGATAMLAAPAAAENTSKQTVLTFNQPVQVPGMVLPAGTYLFRLADSLTNRHIVEIFDQRGRALAIVLTIPTLQPAVSPQTRVLFAAGDARAPRITKWFYPGELEGEQFVYARE
jgi:hypothetical protein